VDAGSLTNTQFQVLLGGGRVGTYELRVTRANYGSSSVASDAVDDFKYEIRVTNVQPNVGSVGGGASIAITGTNFKPDDTQVFIGEGTNMLCAITAITTTSIMCTTPPKFDDSSYDSPVEVIVFGRLTERGTTDCGSGNTCTFEYTSAYTPTLNIPSTVSPLSRRILHEISAD
jgi:IPT/TIG domain